ncbi:aspartate-alanine antiporter [Inquilinus sp. NPDC058860]|uniref:aspartate-alanine antiporter n=1 Tax=Inquilinus sp. NPDC058860 TaxID=3346652 RepID=UPI00369D68C0
MSCSVPILERVPEAAIFLCLCLGFAIGQIRFGSIRFGGVCGTLIVALALGQTGCGVGPGVRSLFFAIFIFALGFSGGPQFFANLNRKGWRFGVLPLVEVATILGLVLAATAIARLDPGTAAGLLAGAATESAVVGTAGDALARLPLDAATVAALQANVATAYTITYIFGLITIVVFTSQLAPRLLGIDLRAEAERLLVRMGGMGADPGAGPAAPPLVGRVHRVTAAAGKAVAETERGLADGVTIALVRRAGADLPVTPGLTLAEGDLVLLHGRRAEAVGAAAAIGPEEAPADGFGLALKRQDVVFTRRGLNNHRFGELKAMADREAKHGVYVAAIARMGGPLPIAEETVLQHGDVLTLQGTPADVARAARLIGAPVTSPDRTDFVILGIGLLIGILIGQGAVPVAGIPLTLGIGGGALLSGLAFGWLNAKRPDIGALPPAAAQILKDFGLAAFIASVGLSAGPQAIELIGRYGLALPLMGVALSLTPALISLYLGRYLLGLEPPVLIGAIAGQQVSTPAISAVVQAAGNATPIIGYTVTYAISNAILPLLGPIIVFLTS